MALAPLLRNVGPSITGKLKKLKFTPKWRLGAVKEERLLPMQQKSGQRGGKHLDGDDTDELPMPKPTAMWYKWPVDLDVNSMSVTTMTETGTNVAQKTNSSIQRLTSTGNLTWTRSIWDKIRLATQVKREPERPEMVSSGTQTLGRVVVELDPEGWPYGSRDL